MLLAQTSLFRYLLCIDIDLLPLIISWLTLQFISLTDVWQNVAEGIWGDNT